MKLIDLLDQLGIPTDRMNPVDNWIMDVVVRDMDGNEWLINEVRFEYTENKVVIVVG